MNTPELLNALIWFEGKWYRVIPKHDYEAHAKAPTDTPPEGCQGCKDIARMKELLESHRAEAVLTFSPSKGGQHAEG